MNDVKQNLAVAVREARRELGLSQEKLAEILDFDYRMILNIETGRGNPQFDNLCRLITYLKISLDKIFYSEMPEQLPGFQKLCVLMKDCTD